MRLSDLVAPVTSANGNDGQLGEDDGPSNGGRHLEESESKIKAERWQKKLTLHSFPVKSGICLGLHGNAHGVSRGRK